MGSTHQNNTHLNKSKITNISPKPPKKHPPDIQKVQQRFSMDYKNHTQAQNHTQKDTILQWISKQKKKSHPPIKTIHTSTSQKSQTSHPNHQKNIHQIFKKYNKDSQWTTKIIHRHKITHKKTPFYSGFQNKKNI